MTGSISSDVRHLQQLIRDLVNASIAPATARVYATGQRYYQSFCKAADINPVLVVCSPFGGGGSATHVDQRLPLNHKEGTSSPGMGVLLAAAWPLLECPVKGIKLKGELHVKPPKFEHIFVAVITFPLFLLCRYF